MSFMDLFYEKEHRPWTKHGDIYMPRELNKEELAVGAIVGLAFVITLKWLVLITIPVCAYLWALGGAKGTSKAWRRVGVPLVLGVLLSIAAKSWLTLASIGPAIGVLAIGYGIPSFNGPDGGMDDKGSSLGRFWYYGFGKEDEEIATSYTRGTIGFLLGLVMITLLWSSVLSWIVGLLILTYGYPAVVRTVK